MQKPTLVLVSGAPGAGKTTIAARPSAGLNIPMVSKDAIAAAVRPALVRD